MISQLTRIRNRKTGRFSSWDVTGRNGDAWSIKAGETRVLADIKGPGQITHIWMTQGKHYRECLLKITFDDGAGGGGGPQVLVPLGDFFCLGNSIVANFQNALFSASTNDPNRANRGCALNCYVPMPFRRRAVVEMVNESGEDHGQYFYIDYETLGAEEMEGDVGYFHAEFRRANPFGGWGPEILANEPEANIVNKERTAWENNYVILETRGRGHYIGCNLSVTNIQGTWWGEGDDMIWVDGYKWPPDLHGTGSEDYLNQAWGMQANAYLHNGSSVFEHANRPGGGLWNSPRGGYQTSYVLHVENPVRFQKEIKVTIEHGHGNHLGNEMCSVAYWYAEKPTRVMTPPAVGKRMPVVCDGQGEWVMAGKGMGPGKKVKVNAEMAGMKRKWGKRRGK